jgi:hypothetical protein
MRMAFSHPMGDDTRTPWTIMTFRDHPRLFAVYCHLQDGIPWALGLYDDDFADNPGPWGRHAVVLTTPAFTLDDLPARWG